MKKEVEFFSEGSKIKGILYLPENYEESGGIPGIVLCHGFAGVKELLLPAYGEVFCREGFAALTFDYRGFGESEGEPGKLSPYAQVRDIRNALTFLQSFPGVSPGKLGLWGTSFGGANAVTAAAFDDRVKCLTVQLAFGDGERVITGNLSDEDKEKLNSTMNKIWSKTVTQNKVMKVAVNRILSDEQSIEFFNKTIKKFPHVNVKIPFFTIKETIDYKPERYLSSVRVPILITGAENDKVNPEGESQSLYEKANHPKELHIVKGAGHYEIYEGKKFKEVVDRQVDLFNRYLK